MVLAVLFIWSMESSSAVTRSWMSVRSNGVMKVRRTAVSTSRVISSASALALENDLAIMLDAVAALEQALQRLGAGDDNRGMPHEEVEEALLLRHQRLEPAEHRILASGENRARRIIAGAL